MNFSNETQQNISRFAKEQSQRYLDAAEMTYIEKLRGKAGQTKRKLENKLARFKLNSEQSREAENDMVLYMTDYISDLMSKGMSEREAFEKAKKELAASDTPANELTERLTQYYANRDPAEYEAVGFMFGGFTILGMVAGALTGYITGGGQAEFLNGGWIHVIVCTVAGMLTGVGLALIVNAFTFGRRGR